MGTLCPGEPADVHQVVCGLSEPRAPHRPGQPQARAHGVPSGQSLCPAQPG
uniref:Alternative protein SMPD4 n=1 Tax=Homo sapiens TaxID=9606 RepID=L8ECH3_HUMAN|nr:alternative protein SMPD4 [Homo sapiens]